MIYDGPSKRLKNAIITLLQGVQYNDEPAFGVVTDNNLQTFKSYPAVQVLPGDLKSERADTGSSERVTAFIVRTRIQMEDTNESSTAAYDRMYDLTDLLIDKIEIADFQHSFADPDGTIMITMTDVTRGDWLEVTMQSGVNLICDVNVEVTYSKNLH